MRRTQRTRARLAVALVGAALAVGTITQTAHADTTTPPAPAGQAAGSVRTGIAAAGIRW